MSRPTDPFPLLSRIPRGGTGVRAGDSLLNPSSRQRFLVLRASRGRRAGAVQALFDVFGPALLASLSSTTRQASFGGAVVGPPLKDGDDTSLVAAMARGDQRGLA